MPDSKYYVWRAECWGGSFVWQVCEQKWGKHVRTIKTFKTERAAHRLCERMNEDWDRFLRREGPMSRAGLAAT